MRKYIVLFLICFASTYGQSIKESNANAIKAYKHKQYDLFLHWAKRVDSLRPAHPNYMYNLAGAYALNNKPDDAFKTLRKIVLMNNTVTFEQDSDFVSLRHLPGFERLLDLKKSIETPVMTSQKVVTLSEKDLHPEGLLYLPKKKLWLAGSIRKGKIVAFDEKTGKCTDWLDTDYPVFSLKQDVDGKYLWVATSGMPQMEDFTPNKDGKGEILKINLRTKAIEKRFSVPGKHVFGDLIVAKKGTVYVSDSEISAVYKIDGDQIKPWFNAADRVCNFQGLCFNADQTSIYLADYLNGIVEIEVANPAKRRWLVFPEDATTKGIDGIAWHDNSIIAIHNGVKPIRIVRYFLGEDGKITSQKIIDNNRAEFAEPTIPFINGNSCYFFANCPWPAYDKQNKLDDSKFTNPMLFRFTL